MISPDSSTDNIVAAGDASTVLFRKSNVGANFTSFNTSQGIVGNAMDENPHLFSVFHSGASSAIIGDTETFTGTMGAGGHPGTTFGGGNLGAATVSLNIAFVGFYAGDFRDDVKYNAFRAWATRYGVTL